MERSGRILSSLVLTAASAGGLAFCVGQIAPTNLPVHPYLFPAIILALLLALSVLRLLLSVFMPPAGGGTPAFRPSRRCVVTAALIGLYAWAMNPLGYVVSSFFYIILQMLVLWEGRKRYGLMAAVALFGSVAVYFLFRNVFNVMLPQGILKIQG